MIFPFIAIGLTGMEIFSYLVHRYVFHGLLWFIHRSHHLPRKGRLELNDSFSLFFGSLACLGIFVGSRQGLQSPVLGISMGVALYGMLYFLFHDMMTHRRFSPFEPLLKILGQLRQSHRKHHQSSSKKGQEPYGFLLFRKPRLDMHLPATPFSASRRVRDQTDQNVKIEDRQEKSRQESVK
ncbi:MAG: sterol desaturase family protein [Methylotenera sp.]|nr:sterol desaturase family protein [Oligoflexia bacterium]